MTIAEEKAEAYIEATLDVDGKRRVYALETEWEIRYAYVAGYAAAERYRLILQAAIRNATPQPEAAPHHEGHL